MENEHSTANSYTVRFSVFTPAIVTDENSKAPAQDALDYEPKRFVEDIWADNVYKDEPSPAVDKAWADLYNGTQTYRPDLRLDTECIFVDFGLSQIPKWQADKMPNRTLPIPADPQYYVMQLTVFHQMHCLVRVYRSSSCILFFLSAHAYAMGRRILFARLSALTTT